MQSDPIRLIAFDADDTLWAHESIFQEAQKAYTANLEHHVSCEIIEEKLYEYERRNLALFGYGIKGFMLSMIETAIEITQAQVTGDEIQQIIDLGKWMIEHPVEVLPHVEETLKILKEDYQLLMITKGDLFDQESKIARSGLAEYFDGIEIVSEKKEEVYSQILIKYGFEAKQMIMIGNSLKSDILPVCKIGGTAIHIPFHVTWVLEQIEEHHLNGHAYHELNGMAQVPTFIANLGRWN